MLEAARRHSHLVTQLVPSPYGLKGHAVMAELLEGGYLGELREVYVTGLTNSLAEPAAPLSWRQDVALSGFNMLALGILHETLLRWAPPPVRVLAQVHAFIPTRIDPESGVRRPVGTPDSVQVLAVLENGARAVYRLSGVTHYGQEMAIWFHGTEGALHYDLTTDRIRGSNRRAGRSGAGAEELEEIPIPRSRAGKWTVEADFIDAIRNGTPIPFTDFEAGVAYMEFTEAVAAAPSAARPSNCPWRSFWKPKNRPRLSANQLRLPLAA